MIRYNGVIAGVATPERVHFAPHLADRPDDDSERRFVFAMGVCAHDIALGELPGPYTDHHAAAYARAFLMPAAELEAHADEPAEELAARFGVPVPELRRRRLELAGACSCGKREGHLSDCPFA
jgi:hypothetical protein